MASSVVITLDTRAPEVVFDAPQFPVAGTVTIPYVVSADVAGITAELMTLSGISVPVVITLDSFNASVPDGVTTLHLTVNAIDDVGNAASYELSFNTTYFSIGAKVIAFPTLSARIVAGRMLAGKILAFPALSARVVAGRVLVGSVKIRKILQSIMRIGGGS